MSTMRAVSFQTFGGPEVLEIVEVERPERLVVPRSAGTYAEYVTSPTARQANCDNWITPQPGLKPLLREAQDDQDGWSAGRRFNRIDE